MFRLGGVYTTTSTSTGTQGGGSVSLNTCQELFVALDLFMLSSFMSDFCKDQRRSDLAAAVTPPLHPARSLHTHTPPVPAQPPDCPGHALRHRPGHQGGHTALVTLKEWLMELRATANSDEDTEHMTHFRMVTPMRAV